MKATTLIFIFSGLIGLNKCSEDIEIKLPTFLIEKNLKTEDSDKVKFENKKDTSAISFISLSDFYISQTSYRKTTNLTEKHIL